MLSRNSGLIKRPAGTPPSGAFTASALLVDGVKLAHQYLEDGLGALTWYPGSGYGVDLGSAQKCYGLEVFSSFYGGYGVPVGYSVYGLTLDLYYSSDNSSWTFAESFSNPPLDVGDYGGTYYANFSLNFSAPITTRYFAFVFTGNANSSILTALGTNYAGYLNEIEAYGLEGKGESKLYYLAGGPQFIAASGESVGFSFTADDDFIAASGEAVLFSFSSFGREAIPGKGSSIAFSLYPESVPAGSRESLLGFFSSSGFLLPLLTGKGESLLFSFSAATTAEKFGTVFSFSSEGEMVVGIGAAGESNAFSFSSAGRLRTGITAKGESVVFSFSSAATESGITGIGSSAVFHFTSASGVDYVPVFPLPGESAPVSVDIILEYHNAF